MLGRSQDVSNAAQRALLHLLCLFNGLEIFEEVAPNIRQVRLVLPHSPQQLMYAHVQEGYFYQTDTGARQR